MNSEILIANLTNPTLLFFLLGVVATLVKSDLSIPESTSKFLSLYLLFSIGFRGGQELAHSGITSEIAVTLLLAVFFACLVPIYAFFILRKKFSVYDAGAVAALALHTKLPQMNVVTPVTCRAVLREFYFCRRLAMTIDALRLAVRAG